MKRRQGFTLIELLVVIAIIAILAAILFPVFAQARDKARSIACLSNMKQIGNAVMMYVQDHDETFPPAYNSRANPQYAWQECIEPYVKAGQTIGVSERMTKPRSILVCPSYGAAARPTDPRAQGGNCRVAELGKVPNRSYAASEWLFGIWSQGSISQNLAAIEFPAQVVAIAETEGSRDSLERDDRPNQQECGTMMARLRHTGGSNHIFADGHAKWYKGPAEWWQRSSSPIVYRHCCDARGNDDAGWYRPIAGCGCGGNDP